MQRGKYYWTGISKEERIGAISDITAIIDRKATILNFQKLSDLSLSFVLELEEDKIELLQQELKNIMFVEGKIPEMPVNGKECLVLFDITFTQGTGDLEIEVPNIPE
jgi:hypothetical protein